MKSCKKLTKVLFLRHLNLKIWGNVLKLLKLSDAGIKRPKVNYVINLRYLKFSQLGKKLAQVYYYKMLR